MIVTLIVGFVVGAFFAQVTPRIAELLARAGIKLLAEELTLVSFALCLAAASALLMLIGVDSYPVLLCLSAALGVARKPIVARISKR